MPSTVWSACLVLIVSCTAVNSDNHRLDIDDLLAYYEPLPENFQSNEQMLDHLHYADISRPQNSPQESQDVESNPAFFHDSKPPSVSSLSGRPLMHLLPKNGGADPLTENTMEEALGNAERWEPSLSVSASDKRAGGDARRFKPTREYKRERNGGMGPSLSVDSSLDVVRQRFMQSLMRRRMMEEKQRQIASNGILLESIGKRDGNHASRSHIEKMSGH